MGKAQSKRSVDITTEVNKEGIVQDEGTGTLGKIEDADQLKPQLNGDANHKDGEAGGDQKQDDKETAENAKDSATEKAADETVAPVAAEATENGAGGDSVAAATAAVESLKIADDEKPQENGTDAENTVNETTTTTLDESKDGVEAGDGAAATPATDSAKKVKKEKSKKRFLSFRSFSFSKKDKQKPAKKEEEKAAAVTNGECEKVPEETTEAVAEQNGVADGEKTAQPTTNGVSDESKTDDAVAEAKAADVVAAAVPIVAAAIVDEATKHAPSKDEIKQVAQETVEEAIVAASKSVDEKINVAVAKPEVNAVNDLQRESIEKIAVVDTNSTITDTPVGVGLGDSTKHNDKHTTDNINENQTNTDTNNPLPNNPPPLPECPPPSQVSVFAETAMSETTAVENDVAVTLSTVDPPSHPIIEPIDIPSDSAAITASANIELIANVDEPIVDAPTVNVIETESSIIVDDTPIVETLNNSLPKPEEIAETIAILDSVNDAEIKAPEEIAADISVDISSPLPQNSLESLPSPQSLSNVSPPSEIDENTTTELANEDGSLVLPPPPPPAVDDEITITVTADDDVVPVADQSSVVENENEISLEQVSMTELEISNDDLPPPPPPAVIDEEHEHESTKTNGNGNVNTNGDDNEIVDALATNGFHLNGNAQKNGDVISDKENGHGKENSITEKLNGDADHKIIEEIVTSPEKLEKLAAANPPPSTEVVASE